jgi:hypothetical protein
MTVVPSARRDSEYSFSRNRSVLRILDILNVEIASQMASESIRGTQA